MVPRPGLALNPTDKLLAVYVGFVTALIVLRGPGSEGRPWLLAAHALFAVLLVLLRRGGGRHAAGRLLHTFYPLALLPVFYAEIGVLNGAVGLDRILLHDAVAQRWEAALFGTQVSYAWIRTAPSIFWSGLFHLAYLLYYPMILLTAPVLAAVGRREAARHAIFAMMLAFVTCYVVFLVYPVAGPNYAFPHLEGGVRSVWSARLVYGTLAGGSSVGAAFPSSHVAATLAAVWGAWRGWRPLGMGLVLPFALLAVGTVYCQMHYGVDAASGLIVGTAAGYGAPWLWRWAAVESDGAAMISSMVPRTSRR